MYFIANSTIYSEDGTLEHQYDTSAISIQVDENSTWVDNQNTLFNLSITRRKELFTQPAIVNWNSTILEVEVLLFLPKLFFEPQNKIIAELEGSLDRVQQHNAKREQLEHLHVLV